jgi:hypothetical protein
MPTYVYTIAASTDDAQEAGGTVTTNGTSVGITAATRYGGFRFVASSNPIPADETPVSAVFGFYGGGALQDTNMILKGEKVTNSAAFATTANNISNRYNTNPTTASVTDTATDIGTGERQIDVLSIYQELRGQVGWTNSAPVTILIKGVDATSTVTIRSFDYGSQIPTLTIVTTTGSAMPKTARIRLSTKVGGLLTGVLLWSTWAISRLGQSLTLCGQRTALTAHQ